MFYGTTTEETILREIHLLWELLGSADNVLRETYMVAAYENPGVPNRRNEIWFIRRADWNHLKSLTRLQTTPVTGFGLDGSFSLKEINAHPDSMVTLKK